MADIGIQVEIYKDTDLTKKLDVLNVRTSPTALAEIGAHGAGSFIVPKLDPKTTQNPALLEYRNVAIIKLNGVVRQGFIIQNKTTTVIGEGEAAEEAWNVSGEALRSWTKDAAVRPPKGLVKGSADTRFFNFATERGSWYDPSAWSNAHNILKLRQPGNPWWGTAPADWPDAPNAWWIWGQPMVNNTHPLGENFFRHEFTLSAQTKLAFFVAIDDHGEVFVNGEQLVEIRDASWQQTTRIEFELPAGDHVIGVRARQTVANSPGGVIGALFSFGDPAAPSAAQLLSYTGQSGKWLSMAYPTREPGWSPGDVLLTLLSEAKARGVRFASNFTPTFTAKLDSAGTAWPAPIAYSFSMGAGYDTVIESLEELSCDIEFNPATFQINAWVKRGVDRSGTVIFQKGKNLFTADEAGQADLANTALLQTSEGWVVTQPTDPTSIQKYGVIETSMSTRMTIAGSKALTDELFRQKAAPEKTATFQVYPTENCVPFVDFNVGDYVSAPGEVVQEKRRVMSIAVSETETGRISYAIEFDTIFKDRQSELEKWVSRQTNSGAMGGGFSNTNPLPPTTVVITPPTSGVSPTPEAPSGLEVASEGVTAPDGTNTADFMISWNTVAHAGLESIIVDAYQVWGRRLVDPANRWVEADRNLWPDPLATNSLFLGSNPPALGNNAISNGYRFVYASGQSGIARVAELRVGTSVPAGGGFWISFEVEASHNVLPLLISFRGSQNASAQLITQITPTMGVSRHEVFVPEHLGFNFTSSSMISIEVNASGGHSVTIRRIKVGVNPSYWEPSQTGTQLRSRWVGATNNSQSVQEELFIAPSEDPFQLLMTVFDTFALIKGNAPEEVWEFKVRAMLGDGTPGYFSPNVSATGALPAPDLAAPTTPALTSKFGLVIARWAGLLNGYAPPKNFWNVHAQVARSANGPWSTVAGQPLTSAGDITISGQPRGEEVWVRLRARDNLGRFSDPSPAASIKVVGTDGSDLEDGTVPGDKLILGTLEVSHVSPSFGGTLNLEANSSINFLVQGMNQTGSTLAAQQEGLNVLKGSVDSNAASIAAAQAGIDATQRDLEGVAETVADAEDKLNAFGTYYRFGTDGAIIGSTDPDQPFELALMPDRVEMRYRGTVVSYWDSGQMIVPSFVGDEVVLANHKIEKYGNGTVVRRSSRGN